MDGGRDRRPAHRGNGDSSGSALNDHDVWGFTASSVEHWNGSTWMATSVNRLLPPKDPHGLNDPKVVGILALSDSNVYAIGNGNRQDEGGPVVVLHFNGHKWSKLATGEFGFGPDFQQFSSDGSGGLWLAMEGPRAARHSSCTTRAASSPRRRSTRRR
jgi:hypothetical protein